MAVTFDDGYRDVYTNAFPLLQEFGIPATVFLTIQFLDDPQLPWWDRLARAVARLRNCSAAVSPADGDIAAETWSQVRAAIGASAWRAGQALADYGFA